MKTCSNPRICWVPGDPLGWHRRALGSSPVGPRIRPDREAAGLYGNRSSRNTRRIADVIKCGDRRRLRVAAAGIPTSCGYLWRPEDRVNKAIEEESAHNPGEMESAPEVLELRDRLIRRLRRTGSSFRRRPHCCGRGPRLIAWRDARLLPMSGSLDMEYSQTPGIIRPWTNPLEKTPAFIPGRG